mgnify:FL=1
MADFVSHHLFGRQALTVFPAPAQRAAACRFLLFYVQEQFPAALPGLFPLPVPSGSARLRRERAFSRSGH